MMNKLRIALSIIVLLSITLNSMGQINVVAKYHVKGMLVDSISGEGEPYANVYIRSNVNPEKVIKMFVTDAGGSFSTDIVNVGKYSISFSSVGKKTVGRIFVLDTYNTSIDLGKIKIAEDVRTLQKVTVVSRRRLIKMDIDKVEYNVAGDPMSQSSNALEIMRRVPYISVNGMSQIKVMGQTTFKIYINGRPTGMSTSHVIDYLKSMPANTIQSVQVIVNPGVKNEAESNSAIINIVKKKALKGYLVSLRDYISVRDLNSSVHTVLQTNKLSINAHTSLASTSSPMRKHSYQDKTVTNIETQAVQATHRDAWSRESYYSDMGLELNYEPDSMKLFVASIEYEYDPSKSFRNTAIVQSAGDGSKIYSYDVFDNIHSTAGDRVLQFAYQQKFKREGELLSFIFQNSRNTRFGQRYSDYLNVSNFELPYMGIWTNSRKKQNRNILQGDFSYPLSESQRIDVGMEATLYRNRDNFHHFDKNERGDYGQDNTMSYDYIQHQDVYATYAEYALQLKKWSVKGGVRYEYTHMKETGRGDFSDNYGNIVPSVSLLYKINDAHHLRLTYNTSISRPNFVEVNSHVDNTDPKNLYYGNPELKCNIYRNIRLYYDYLGEKINFTSFLNYTLDKNDIAPYIFSVGDVLHHTYRNSGITTGFLNNMAVNGSLASFLDVDFTAGWGFQTYHRTSDYPGSTNFFYELEANLLWTLPNKWYLNMHYTYDSKYHTTQGENSSECTYDVSLQKSFCKGKLTFSVDAFNFLKPHLLKSSFSDAGTYRYYNENRIYIRSFGLSVSWRFGKLKKKNQTLENRIEPSTSKTKSLD